MTRASNRQIAFVVQLGYSNLDRINTVYLIRIPLDDFGLRTSFHLFYINESGKEKNFGIVRIIRKGQQGGFTELEDEFLSLDESYCSLGNSQNYYEEMMNLDEEVRDDILVSLRDCVYNSKIFNEFKNEPAMVRSLLRDVSRSSFAILFPSILLGNARLTPYHFQFQLHHNERTIIDLNVQPKSLPPTNIHVLIGRNGVGKTRIISGIMDCITRASDPSSISMPGGVKFIDTPLEGADQFGNEKFSNLIVVVFSAFDNFKPIQNFGDINSVPCNYIGLKGEDNVSFKTPKDLNTEFSVSLFNCLNSSRRHRWVDAIKILCSDPILKEYNLHELEHGSGEVSRIATIFENLSSGHRIILLALTRIVELLNERSLVLLDEPENHLHPPLLSSFIKALSSLATQRNAVALIATHSPVVLQEVPRICTTKISRVGEIFSLDRPAFETYGENIDVLTRDVFRLEVEDSGFYKSIYEHLEKVNFDYDRLLSDYEGRLGSEAMAVALAVVSAKRGRHEQYRKA